MEAIKYQSELGRMCESYSAEGVCGECPLRKLMKGTDSCVLWVRKHPEQAVSIVEQWSNEHPVKTCLDDFKEKYPNGIIGYKTWCQLYNSKGYDKGNYPDWCKYHCDDCRGWSEPAEKYL